MAPVWLAAARAPRARAAALDDDDRFGLREVAGGAHELAGVGDGLDVEDDAGRVGVGAEVVDEVAEVDVGHGADADEGAEADLVGGRPVEDRRAEGARLTEEGDAPRRRDHVGEGRVEAARRADVAEAVGAEHAHAVGLGDGAHFLLELLAGFAGLSEAGTHDHGAADPRLAAVAHGVRHGFGRDRDDRQIDFAGHLSDRRVGVDALDRLRRYADRIDGALVVCPDQVVQQDVADRALAVGGADHGDALGVEQPLQVACSHASCPSSRGWPESDVLYAARACESPPR